MNSSRSLSYYLASITKIFGRRGLRVLLDPLHAYREIAELNAHRRTLSLLSRLDYTYSDLYKNKELMQRFNQMKNVKVETINWFLPNFKHAFGGIQTILRFADYFHTTKGIRNRFLVYGDSPFSASNFMESVAKSFPSLSSEEAIILGDDVNLAPRADICIATTWDSAYLLLKFNKTDGKFYFIQDYEPLFYPAGAVYGLAEATYGFGFHAITNTPGVSKAIKQNYNNKAEYFVPSVDRKVFYPSERKIIAPSEKNPFTIFFYARPAVSRNAFDLGVFALQKAKEKYGRRVRIYTAGSNWHPEDYDMKDKLSSLGTLPYEKTAELYRKCDLGIVFMFTKHPSYIPFELMACGCPVMTNYNPSTTWLLKDSENCVLTQPTVSSICEKIDDLMTSLDLRARLIKGGLESIEKNSWDKEIEKIYNFICHVKTHARC